LFNEFIFIVIRDSQTLMLSRFNVVNVHNDRLETLRLTSKHTHAPNINTHTTFEFTRMGTLNT